MAVNANPQYKFPQELVLQLPFTQISDFAKTNRAPQWRKISAEIEIIARANKDEIINLFGNSMIKAMEEDVKAGDISEDTLKEIKTKIEYINSKFKYLNEYYEQLNAYDKRSLLMPFIDRELTALVNYKDAFMTNLTSKTEWDQNDSLMYSYYLLYLENINYWRAALHKASKDNIETRLNVLNSLMFIFKPILVAYLLRKQFSNEILVGHIAQLRAYINPTGIYVTEPKISEIGEAISAISPA